MSGRSKNGRRLFRAAVRLHESAAVRTNLSPYRAVFEAFLRLIYRIRQVPVCTQPPYYPPFALEVPAATAAGIFHFRRAAAPSCRFPGVFSSLSGCFSVAFRVFSRRLPGVFPPLSGYHSGTFWLLSHCLSTAVPLAFPVTSGCFPAALWLPFRHLPVIFPLSSRLSSRLFFRRLLVAFPSPSRCSLS